MESNVVWVEPSPQSTSTAHGLSGPGSVNEPSANVFVAALGRGLISRRGHARRDIGDRDDLHRLRGRVAGAVGIADLDLDVRRRRAIREEALKAAARRGHHQRTGDVAAVVGRAGVAVREAAVDREVSAPGSETVNV